MAERPRNLHPSQSFTRLHPTRPKSPPSRTRASTLQGPPAPVSDPLKAAITPEEAGEGADGDDVFAPSAEEAPPAPKEATVPQSFEELPIEIRSLTERFLDSLSAKVHPSPLSADGLSDLFQDFYTRAAARISTHIATLSARLTSDTYKKTSASSRPGTTRADTHDGAEQQMLSVSEMSDRKKARRLLESKRAALEEAVERAVCEKVYDRIWRHRSTDDEERDHKLRSRTAALSLVGIGLKELLMTAEDLSEEEHRKTRQREGEIREYLSAARDDIVRMNDVKYPLGKLYHLTAAHKSIVEALSKIFPASSSADEILPTLIYTLITMPPPSLNVIGDLRFIQRFRGSSRMDGETAYCLVNLEAAISFLETVDLSSLRAEDPAGPGKLSSQPSTPRYEVTPMALGLGDAPSLGQQPAAPAPKPTATKDAPDASAGSNRRLSTLIQSQTNRIEAASDAVRDSILESADQALGRINNTLDNSFKFLFGRIKEGDPNSPVQEHALPKTLEDARKLVSSPSRLDDDDNASISAASSLAGDDRSEDQRPRELSAKMTDMFAGRRSVRDRSADSTQSGGSNSGRRPGFSASPNDSRHASTASKEPAVAANTSAVDSIRSMGNSLNPLNRFASMNVLPRFGRATSSSASTPATTTPSLEQTKPFPTLTPLDRAGSGEAAQAEEKGARAVAALGALARTAPPVKRFVDAQSAQDLRLRDVEELLKDYQRLATALRGALKHGAG